VSLFLPCVLQHSVRSIVLPLHDSDAAVQITTAVKRALHELLSPDSVWWQDEHLMHAPLFHATIVEVRHRPYTQHTPDMDNSMQHSGHTTRDCLQPALLVFRYRGVLC
jgi:hypothetical protein